MPAQIRRWGSRALFTLPLTLIAPLASAQPAPDRAGAEADDDKECARQYSIFSPVPQRCLGPIETDRPSKADTPHTVPAGHAQVESAMVEYEVNQLVGPSDNTLNVGSNMYKLGVADNLGPIKHWDVQLLHSVGSYGVRSRRFVGTGQVTVRSKVNVYDGAVSVTLTPVFVAPLANGVTPEAGGYAFFNLELPGRIAWDLNLGGQSETDPATGTRFATPVLMTALTRDLVGPLSVFAEFYGDTTSRDPSAWNCSVDGGAMVALGRDWQVDAGAYFGVAGVLPRATPFLGLSYRR